MFDGSQCEAAGASKRLSKPLDRDGRGPAMRISYSLGFRSLRARSTVPALLAALLACLLAWSGAASGQATGGTKEPIPIQFSFDRPLDASMAPFVVAASRGLFGGEGLSVAMSNANSSAEAIERVARDDSDLGLVDLNELIRYRDKPDAPQVKAVFVWFNRNPYAIVARKSRGIHTLTELEGKTVGVADTDFSIRLWPWLAKQNGVKASAVKFYRMSAAVREPILSAGQVDAVAGFSYLSAVNLRDRGIPANDLAVLRYADHGSEAYGFAVIVNPSFAANKPDAVRGFIRALVAATHTTIREPERAIDEVVSRIEGGMRDLELERLRTVLAENILTPEVKRNGLGGIDAARFEHSINEIADDFKFHKRPSMADIFDESFLPPVGGRLIN
jgi:NitT/TauT family transport system substrate-binding protein